MKKAKSINQITILNLLSTILTQGIVFFTIPIFTRMLGTEQYGIYSVFNSWVAIMTCFMGLGSVAVIGSGRYHFKDKYYEFRSSVLLYGTFVSLIIIILLLILKPIEYITNYKTFLVFVMLFTAMSNYIFLFYQNCCIYEKRAVANFVASFLLSVSSVVLSIVLIYKYNSETRYLGRVYGSFIPHIVLAIVVWFILFKKKPVFLKREYCKYAFFLGCPIVFNGLAQNILSQSDRVMMQYMQVSDSEIGIYSFFYSFVMILNIVLNALNISWCPFYYDDLDKKEWTSLRKKSKNYIELFTVLSVGFVLLSREVAYFMADSTYWSGMRIIPILVLAVYFIFMYQFAVNFEYFHKKTKVIAVGTIIAGLINICLNIVWIPIWGMYGAALATTLSYVILFVMHYIIVKNMKELVWGINLLDFVPGLGAVMISIVLFLLFDEQWIVRWGIGAIIGVWEIFRLFKRKTIF